MKFCTPIAFTVNFPALHSLENVCKDLARPAGNYLVGKSAAIARWKESTLQNTLRGGGQVVLVVKGGPCSLTVMACSPSCHCLQLLQHMHLYNSFVSLLEVSELRPVRLTLHGKTPLYFSTRFAGALVPLPDVKVRCLIACRPDSFLRFSLNFASGLSRGVHILQNSMRQQCCDRQQAQQC